MKKLLVFFIIPLCTLMYAQSIDLYTNLRHSSRDVNGNLHLRWEEYSEVPGLQYEVFHSLGGDWQSAVVTPMEGLTKEALLPYEFGQKLRYRMRVEMEYGGENVVFMQPAYLDADSFPLPRNNMALIGNDPHGDSLMVYSPHLDITESYVATTEEKIYRTIANSSGSFPTMQSLSSYNIYACSITNFQSASDTLLYAMVYSFNIPGILSNGLYKIGMGEGDMPSFTRLGNIQSQVSDGLLHMCCDWADLVADPDFGGWPNIFNSLIFMDLTMQINLDISTLTPEFSFGDSGGTALVEFEDYTYDVVENTLPVLKFDSIDPDSHTVHLLYHDAEQDFPLNATVSISNGSGGFIYMDMNPIYNPDGTITFIETSGANTSYSVSDNGIDFVGLGPVSNEDSLQVPVPALGLQLPNPICPAQQLVEIKLSGLQQTALQLSVYNIKGQKVLDLPSLNPVSDSAVYTWNRANNPPLANGVYFMRLSQPGQNSVQRFIISK